MKRIVLGMFLSLLLCGIAAGVPAVPKPITLTQPDGYSFQAQIKGDERRHWVETPNGYTITKSGNTWYYASQKDGMLAASGLAVGTGTPVGIAQHLTPEPIQTNLAAVAQPAITGRKPLEPHYPLRLQQVQCGLSSSVQTLPIKPWTLLTTTLTSTTL